MVQYLCIASAKLFFLPELLLPCSPLRPLQKTEKRPHHNLQYYNQTTNKIIIIRSIAIVIKMTGLHRPITPPGIPPPSARRRASKLSFGTVCSSNINRSMEAHVRLQNAGELIQRHWLCVNRDFIVVLSRLHAVLVTPMVKYIRSNTITKTS